MMNDYLKIVKSLPRPTGRQTALFASYVADAHSWYKHLPIHKKVPFQFFLDPHAGMYVARDAQGRGSLRAIEDTTGHLHYTAQTTADYRRRFGFWNYDAKYGTSLIYHVDDHVADLRPLGPGIVNSQGDWIPVSSDVLKLGRADANAFVHRHPSLQIWESMLGDSQWPDEANVFPRVEQLLKVRVGPLQPHIDLATLPPAMKEAINQREVYGGLWEQEKLFEELLDLVSSEQSKAELFPVLLEHLELRNSQTELQLYLRIVGISDPESIFDRFSVLLAAERLRQLRELKAAMNRVVDFLYGVRDAR
jgi:hypothetical protein